MHEIGHILVFNPVLFSMFEESYDGEAVIPIDKVIADSPDNPEQKMIVSKNVKEIAQELFNCKN